MEIIPVILYTEIGENHLVGRREGRFHLIDIEKDKTEEYEISAAVINDLEKEAISYIRKQSAWPQNRQPTPYEEDIALHGERKIELLLSNTIQLSENVLLGTHSKAFPRTKSTSKEEFLLSQKLLIPKLMKYLKARAPNTTLNIEGGLCFGLTSLYCYYQFIGKSQDFFDAIRKVHSLINTISFDETDKKEQDELTDQIDKKDYDKLTDDQQFLERFCNDVLFFQEARSFGSTQNASLKNMNFVSEDPAIQNLRSQFTFTSAFNYNHATQSHPDLEHILYQILTSDGEKRKFLFMFTGYHAFGIHYQDKKCYLYDPNTSGVQYICSIDPENPFPAIKSLAKQLISELSYFESESFSLGIDVLSDENLSVLKTKETNLHRLMVTHSYDFPGQEYSPLFIASQNNFKDNIEILLEKGADPNIGNENKITPLHNAASQGHKDVIEMLLKKGADPNVRTKNEVTPLHNAAIKGHKDCTQILLEAGADPNVRTKDGITPLHNAASQGHKDVIEMLLKKGADPNVRTKDGITPLHNAAIKGHKDCIEILLKKGADPTTQNKDGNTPLDFALTNGHTNCVKLLTRSDQF